MEDMIVALSAVIVVVVEWNNMIVEWNTMKVGEPIVSVVEWNNIVEWNTMMFSEPPPLCWRRRRMEHMIVVLSDVIVGVVE